MAEIVWTVKDLTEALKRFPPEAKVYYEMGPNGAGTIGRAQYVRAEATTTIWECCSIANGFLPIPQSFLDVVEQGPQLAGAGGMTQFP